jgi:hypothetical protein
VQSFSTAVFSLGCDQKSKLLEDPRDLEDPGVLEIPLKKEQLIIYTK